MKLQNLTYEQMGMLWNRVSKKRWHFEPGEWKSNELIRRLESIERRVDAAKSLKNYSAIGITADCPLRANIEHMKREFRA